MIFSFNDERWQLASVRQKPFGFAYDLAEAQEWIPATVPGDVRLDLLRAGKIPDPFIALENKASQWVDGLDWWYVRDVGLPLMQDVRRFLVFDGIDYQSAVFWNGVELGRHTGMFSRQIYEIPRQQVARSRLAVRVWGSDALPRFKLNASERALQSTLGRLSPTNPPFADRLATLKCQMSFGWDFAPRLRTCGIWDNAALVETRGILIRDTWIQGVPDGRVQARLVLDSDSARRASAQVQVHGKNFETTPQTFEFPIELQAGVHEYPLSLQLHDPHSWNPWDRGAPNVYTLTVELFDASGQLDTSTTSFGLRTIDLMPNTGAPEGEAPWTFIVNGVPEFIRGANWTPADSIPGRVTAADYAELVKLARDANINLLRVWGGGLREKRAFYDECDERGILLWQEFPFSGAPLDSIRRDGAFLDFVRTECGEIVRALRSHPSLVLWCGGNEYHTGSNGPLVRTLRQVVATQDGARPFKPGSPSNGEHHNWRIWHWKANTRDYRDDAAGFLGEFGLQAPPDVETLRRFMLPAGLWPPGEMWVYHNAELDKLWRYARAINPHIDSPEAFVEASQTAQARGLQVVIEHARRHKGRMAGCAFWQFNEPWPAICWSILAYDRTPKIAYRQVQQLYNPVLVSFYYPLQARRAGERVQGELWLINDTLHAVQGELRVSLNGARVETRQVEIGPNRAICIGELEVVTAPGANALYFQLAVGETVISTNEYDLNYSDRGEMSPLLSPLHRFFSSLQS
ncbi:MAG: glycoside hydrolase family 2 TIM barrel-domain containing protein [Anaerolineae bacterium]